MSAYTGIYGGKRGENMLEKKYLTKDDKYDKIQKFVKRRRNR